MIRTHTGWLMATDAFALADTHLGHGPAILRFRDQFSSYQEHDDHIIKQINDTVNPNSTLILAGDVAIKAEGWERLQELHCRNIIIVPGNHCGERARIKLGKNMRIVGADSRRLPIGRLEAVITHIPVHPQCLDRWHVNIHGHLHADTVKDDPRYYCVSCEQLDYRPRKLEDIYYDFLYRAVHAGELDLPDWVFDRQIQPPEKTNGPCIG